MADTLIDTGLLGEISNQPPSILDPVSLSPPTVIIPSTGMPAGWTIQKVASLVRDCAHMMYDLPVILKTHSLTQPQYDRLAATEAFQNALQVMTVEWNSIGNTQKRLALEAAIALEDALPTVAARLSKATEPLPGVVELAKLLAKMAGIGEHTTQNIPSERFKITINLGADTEAFDKSKPIINIETGPPEPVQQLPQGT